MGERRWSEQRTENIGKDSMVARCLPLGPQYSTDADSTGGGMMKIAQTPALILILNPDLTYRQIFMDGRPLETAPNPTWMGYSVGHWEAIRWWWKASDSTTGRGSIPAAIPIPRLCE